VTGEFSLAQDFPDAVPFWPGDFRLAVTYTLFNDRLRVDALVANRGPGALPFGLGYHPYFQLPGVSEHDFGRYKLRVSAVKLWESVELLPTGVRQPIPSSVDFRKPRPIAETVLDHVFTVDRTETDSRRNLNDLAELSHPDFPGRVRIHASPDFGELVLFTPPHRQAVAIEPYTCSADAANLAVRGIDSGWRVIQPLNNWNAAVEYLWITDA
jgi:aldose 1-epimerase